MQFKLFNRFKRFVDQSFDNNDELVMVALLASLFIVCTVAVLAIVYFLFEFLWIFVIALVISPFALVIWKFLNWKE